jgi:hypothetical protein
LSSTPSRFCRAATRWYSAPLLRVSNPGSDSSTCPSSRRLLIGLLPPLLLLLLLAVVDSWLPSLVAVPGVLPAPAAAAAAAPGRACCGAQPQLMRLPLRRRLPVAERKPTAAAPVMLLLLTVRADQVPRGCLLQ